MAAISAWISASVLLSGGGCADPPAPAGDAFSWSCWPAAGFEADLEDLDFGGGWEIWTWWREICQYAVTKRASCARQERRRGEREANIKLPPLDVLARVLVGDYDDELGDFAADHPLVELGHDFLDVGLDLVVGGDCRRGVSCGGIGSRRGTAVPSMLRPYFLTLKSPVSSRTSKGFDEDGGDAHAVKSSAGYTPRWNLYEGRLSAGSAPGAGRRSARWGLRVLVQDRVDRVLELAGAVSARLLPAEAGGRDVRTRRRGASFP